MSRRVYWVGFAALAVIAALAVYVATQVSPSDLAGSGDLSVKAASVPSLAPAKGWLNSPPLGPSDLKGKVVVYDFWTYSCINCQRTLPHLRALYDRYRADGLVIVGIHAPEFDFEKDHGNVSRAVQQLGVTWPVAFDDDMAIWNSFGNNYWPEEYLTDRDGRLRQVYIGEGRYDEKENDVRTLLGVATNAPRAGQSGADVQQNPTQTPEIHTGLAFDGGQFSSSPEPYQGGTQTFSAPNPVRQDTFALQGPWTVQSQSVDAADASSALVLQYRATEVNVVAGPGAAGGVVHVAVEIDGTVTTTLDVGADDLYHAVVNGPSGSHTLVLRPDRPGLQVFAFTFGLPSG